MAVPIPKFKPWQWAVLALGAIAALAGALLLMRALSVHDAIEAISRAGPLPFFGSLVVLPAVGAPVSAWNLLAGKAFGLGVAIPGCLLAIALNTALTYGAARWWLRPTIVRLVERMGHKVPVVRPEDYWNVALLVRITPGPPYFVQSYLLGLAGIPFGIYMAVSVPVVSVMSVGFIVFGESLLSGKSGMVFVGVTLVLVALVALRIVRNIVQRRARLAGGVGEAAVDSNGE